jgi:hypothetical protein
MAITITYQSHAMAETTKRLLAQLVNEGLVSIHLVPPPPPLQLWSCVLTATNNNATRKAQADLVFFTSPLSRHHWRPNDFKVPLFLNGADQGVEESDPGSVFEFFAPGFACDESIKNAISRELRNCAAMSSSYDLVYRNDKWLTKRRQMVGDCYHQASARSQFFLSGMGGFSHLRTSDSSGILIHSMDHLTDNC